MRHLKLTEDIVWTEVASTTKMVADGTLSRADMDFGGVTIKIYQAGLVVRLDIQSKE
jgi:hypothetical protein